MLSFCLIFQWGHKVCKGSDLSKWKNMPCLTNSRIWLCLSVKLYHLTIFVSRYCAVKYPKSSPRDLTMGFLPGNRVWEFYYLQTTISCLCTVNWCVILLKNAIKPRNCFPPVKLHFNKLIYVCLFCYFSKNANLSFAPEEKAAQTIGESLPCWRIENMFFSPFEGYASMNKYYAYHRNETSFNKWNSFLIDSFLASDISLPTACGIF